MLDVDDVDGPKGGSGSLSVIIPMKTFPGSFFVYKQRIFVCLRNLEDKPIKERERKNLLCCNQA